MAESVGQIGLDLQVNQGQFNKQLNSIQSTAGKVGKVLAAAFAVKEIAQFGKQCIDLGSDLAEVQNVVDVTFPGMKSQVDDFAKSAADSFGLSETMAKKFTGTFGAMAKAFGFTEQQAYNMSTSLTGLAGDVASFYNITQDEAYTKLKSVFSGETETLKDLGIVMTQTALDQYALANGFGKTTSAMSEQEKVALRYAFVQQQLALATGDFTRTSGSWANQVRILKLRFDSLRASIGKGLIAVLTPVIKMLNLLLAKLKVVADAFAKFTQILTGKKGSSGGSSGGTTKTQAATVADDVKNIGTQTTKTTKKVKELKRTLAGFDEINALQKQSTDDDDDSGKTSGGTTGGTSASVGSVDLANSDVGGAVDKLDSKVAAFFDKMRKAFIEGFKLSFDSSELDKLWENIKRLGKNLESIFGSKEVKQAASKFALAFSKSLGQVVGAAASIAVSIGNGLVGGLNKYLESHKEFIKNAIVNLFDIGTELVTLIGNFATAIATVFLSIGSESGQKLIGGIMSAFGNAALGMANVIGATFLTVLKLALQPIIDNADKIREVFENIFDVLSPIFIGIGDGIAEFYDALFDLYNKVLKPIINMVIKFISNTLGKFLDWLNSVLKPLGGLSQSLSGVWKAIGWVIGGITTVIGVIKGFQMAVTAITTVISVAKGIMGGLSTAFSLLTSPVGIVIVIIGALVAIGVLLYKNWDKIKEKAKELAGKVVEFFEGIPKFWGDVWDGVKEKAEKIWDGIKTSAEDIWGKIQTKAGELWGNIRDAVKEKAEDLAEKAGNAISTLRTNVNTIWTNVKTAASNTWKNVKNGVTSKASELAKNAKNSISNLRTGMSTIWTGVKSAAKTTWTNVKTTVGNAAGAAKTNAVKAFNIMKNGIGNTCGKVKSAVTKGFNAAVKWLTDLPSKAISWGGDFISGFADGVVKAANDLLEKVRSLANSITSYLHFSRPDVGPLREYEKWMPDFMQGLARGIDQNKSVVLDSVKDLASDMTINPNVMTPSLASIGGGGTTGGTENPMIQSNDMLIASMSQLMNQMATLMQNQENSSNDSEPNVAVYIGEQQLDSIIVSAQNRRNLRSGGRA